MVVQPFPSDTWIWYAVAYAVSQLRTTWLMVAVAPRSTWSHWGSLKALDQRVPVLPSTALEAGVPEFSVDEAVAGLPWERRVAAWAWRAGVTSVTVSARAMAHRARSARGRRRGGDSDLMVLLEGSGDDRLWRGRGDLRAVGA